MAAHSDTGNKAGGTSHAPTDPAPHGAAAHDVDHGSFIKTPRQLIIIIALALVVPTLLIIMFATFAVSGKHVGAGADAMTPEAIEARISPVAGFELRDASAPVAARSGEEVYKAVCGACHAVGAAGAPKLADKGAWGPRLATGLESLIHSALKGKGAMPAQGGGDYSELEVTKAVVYMANESGGSFEEPKADAATAKAEGESKGEGAKEAK